MSRVRIWWIALWGGMFLCLPAAGAGAQTVPDKDAIASVNILPPGSVRKLQNLNFAWLAVTAAGTATVDPNTDLMSVSGGVAHVGGTPYAAEFEAVSPKKGVVIIRLPKTPATLTRSGGTETMTVGNWTMNGSDRRNVSAKEPFAFKVGGTLTVAANQAEGMYVGEFTVEIQYP